MGFIHQSDDLWKWICRSRQWAPNVPLSGWMRDTSFREVPAVFSDDEWSKNSVLQAVGMALNPYLPGLWKFSIRFLKASERLKKGLSLYLKSRSLSGSILSRRKKSLVVIVTVFGFQLEFSSATFFQVFSFSLGCSSKLYPEPVYPVLFDR